MDKYIKYSDIPFCKIELEERCHNDRWTEIHEVAYKTEIDQIPAADVAPVRHGQWEFIKSAPWYHKCNQCQCFLKIDDITDGKANYCPNCGVKMDGESNA